MKNPISELRAEVMQLLDTIDRMDARLRAKDDCYGPAKEVGELRHRSVVIKRTLTRVSKFSTYDLRRIYESLNLVKKKKSC